MSLVYLKVEKMEDETHHICIHCEKAFSNRSNLQRHCNNAHRDKTSQNIITCSHCASNFNSKSNLIRHFSTCSRNIANKEYQVKIKQVKCAMCDYENSRANVSQHYNQQHNIVISTETVKFNNFEEFQKWKSEIERTDISNYVRYDTRKLGQKTHYYYRCHRDGFFKSAGKGIRRLKTFGSNKMNGFCPSKLDVTVVNENGQVSVKFVKTHVGHQMELRRISLGKSERDFLAAKLSQKIPFDEVLNNIRDNINENKMERLHLLTRKDLFNIQKLYNLNKSIRHGNDCVSVEAWITEMQENSCDSVIRFYKGQGEESGLYSELQKDDFLLIVMNDSQMEMLKKFGNDCICIDSTHGLNRHNFELTTLMVLDELRQGFPCLFTFSNRSDSIIFRVIFNVIKNVLGSPLTPSVFMSDMAENFYTTWCDVMGPVNCRLFCSWHVVRAWRKNISSKIKNTEKQSATYGTLRTLLEEQDQNAFEKMLQNFISSTQTDSQLTNFGKYFAKNYYSSRTSWAYCHRKHVGLNQNMHLERMHGTLEHIYLKGKTAKRLDTAINAIMKLVRDKLYERLNTLHEGKISTKLCELRKRHKNMDHIKDATIVEKQGIWTISSSTGSERYNIERANNNCLCELKCMDCDTCIHAYICSCPDSSVKWNMCKHIHLLCQHLVKSWTFEGSTDDNINDDSNLIVDVDPKEVALKQLTNAVSSKPSHISDLQNYKTKLLEKFQTLMETVTTTEECGVIEKALLSLESTLTAMKSSQQSFSCSSAQLTKRKIDHQRRFYSTKKKA